MFDALRLSKLEREASDMAEEIRAFTAGKSQAEKLNTQLWMDPRQWIGAPPRLPGLLVSTDYLNEWFVGGKAP